MEEWKEYKLNDVATLSTGFPFDGHKYAKEGIRVVRGDNVTIGSLRWDTDKDKRWNEPFNRASEYSLRADDIVIGMDGSRVGKNRAQIKQEDLPLYIAQRVACIRHNDLSLQSFLYYQIFSQDFENYIKAVQTGTSIPHVSLKQIGDFPIMLPSLKVQQKIADILKTFDKKIEVNRKLNDNFTLSFLFLTCFVLWLLKLRNDNLEQQAQALFKSWFVDFEPFKDGEFVESEMGMIPKGWIVGDIYNYVDVIYGAPYKSSMFNENKEGLPLIRIRDLKTNSPQFFTPEILPNTEYIDAGDIIAGMDAEFAPYLWLGEKGVLNQRCCKFKAKNNSISNYYILFLVKPELEYVQSYKTGTTVSHLGKSDIDRFKFIIPPLDVVLAFSKKVNYMKEEVVNRARESRHLAQLRDTLLPRLMSGELKVNEVDCLS